MKEKLASFKRKELLKILCLEQFENAIFSSQFLAELWFYREFQLFNVASISDSVREIESNCHLVTEKDRAFGGDILGGYRYKHWFEARFIARNLQNHWKVDSNKSLKMLNQIKKTLKDAGLKEGDSISENFAGLIARDMVDGFFARRNSGKLTGERIIFTNVNGKNYYITTALHSEKDEAVKLRIENSINLDDVNVVK